MKHYVPHLQSSLLKGENSACFYVYSSVPLIQGRKKKGKKIPHKRNLEHATEMPKTFTLDKRLLFFTLRKMKIFKVILKQAGFSIKKKK